MNDISYFIYEHATGLARLAMGWLILSLVTTVLWSVFRHFEKKRTTYYLIDLWGADAGNDRETISVSDLSR